MASIVHFHRVRYAIVEARYNTARSERLVVAYHNEKSLREFIVVPRIIASGFSSIQQAREMLDAFDAHQGSLRYWMRRFEAGLSTIVGYPGWVRGITISRLRSEVKAVFKIARSELSFGDHPQAA